MKNILTCTLFLFSTIVFAQSGINYKALIKDNGGNVLVNQSITVQFGILEDVTEVYSETHTPTTDASGLVIVNIGEGTPISGTFSGINWGSDDYFLNVQIDTGSGLTDMGTTQFMSVPYAISAANVQWVKTNDNVENTNSGNVGVGESSPSQKLDVNGKIKIGNDNISPTAGTIRFDETTNEFEGHNGTDWISLNNKPDVYVDGSYSVILGSTVRNTETDYANPIIVPEDGEYLLSVSAYFSSFINEQYASGTPPADAPYDNRGRLRIYVNDVSIKLLECGNGIIDRDGSTYHVSFAPGTNGYTTFINFNAGDEIRLTKNMQAVPAFVPGLSIPDLWLVRLDTFYILKMK